MGSDTIASHGPVKVKVGVQSSASDVRAEQEVRLRRPPRRPALGGDDEMQRGSYEEQALEQQPLLEEDQSLKDARTSVKITPIWDIVSSPESFRSSSPAQSAAKSERDAAAAAAAAASEARESTESTKTSVVSWIPVAAASGACAACNGVFAKLTTTALTTTWSTSLASLLSGTNHPPAHLLTSLTFTLRASFLLLNFAFNALMWTLFTIALTRASSTTRVSLVNTSANFLFTALAGAGVFGEHLPPLWWLGAAGLCAGNVIVGRRDAGEKQKQEISNDITEQRRTRGHELAEYMDVDASQKENGDDHLQDPGGIRDKDDQ